VRINRVVLENYGLYAGRNVVDLIPTPKGTIPRPIILIGGMNGAGKTTLLDGIRHALYGKSAIQDRISERAYEEHLRGLVHRSRGVLINLDYARIGVEFALVMRGTRETYYVERNWSLKNGNNPKESLVVRKRPETSNDPDTNTWPPLNEIAADLRIEPEHWQDFLNDVVPERLSQLFFFDGEKIKRIADDISGDAAVAEAIRSLLGLDTVDMLKSDLAILAAREAKKYVTPAESADLEHLDQEINRVRAEITRLASEEIPKIESTISGTQAEIRRLETHLREQGGAFAHERSTNQQRRVAIENEILIFEKEVRRACEGLLPLALCPSVSQLLQKRLQAESRLRTSSSIRAEIESLKNNLVAELSKAPELKQSTSRKAVLRLVENTVTTFLGLKPGLQPSQASIALSEADAARVSDWLSEARAGLAPLTNSICQKLEAAERELQKVSEQIKKAPEESVLEPIFRDLSSQYGDMASVQADLKKLAELKHTMEADLAAKLRTRDQCLESAKEKASSRKQIGVMTSIQGALDKYLSRLTKLKIDTLCTRVTECFNNLSRKGDLLHSISINPESFEVKLRDHSGYTIRREELSAGEKQILAISILWGLSKTSGRPLPVIVDTPLGRLDSEHRMNLVQNYFPKAGHQVILLSTDTEVDKPLFLELKPHVSHCYHLSYDKEERATRALREYFWKERVDA
jgi:DNA sulfur modification protein DndD